MEDLVALLPRKLVAAVLVPFAFGMVVLALLVEPSGTGGALVFLLFVGGAMVFVLLALGLSLLVIQSQGIEKQPGGGD